MLSINRLLKGELLSNDFGFFTNIPPETIATNQCKLLLNIVRLSVLYTLLVLKLPQISFSKSIASTKESAFDAITLALIAPADVPLMTLKGLLTLAGRILEIAFNTPI